MSQSDLTALLDALKRALMDFEIGEADASSTVRHRVEGAVIVLEGALGRTDEDLFETLTSEWSSTSRSWV